MEGQDIRKVLIIGSGTMGQQIGVQCALFGCEVVIYALDEKEKAESLRGIDTIVTPPLLRAGMATREEIDGALSRIRYILSPSDTPSDIDLVSESVPEKYEIKEAVWSQFAPYFPKSAILTTNTSGLAPSRYAHACGAPERFLAWHFHTPIFFQNVVDVMPVPQTDPAYVRAMEAFSERIHQVPILLERETPGYLANNMLMPVLFTAMELYCTGSADYTAIDRAWMGVRRTDMGPFGIMDKIGLDVMYHGAEGKGARADCVALLKDMVERGDLGVKSGKGFYDYPDPVFSREDFVQRARPVSE